MGLFGKILSLSYDTAEATKTSAVKSYYRSVRLIKDEGYINPGRDSKYNNVLLNGKCIDPENRNLYAFYVDTFFNSAWIIEINIDSRVLAVVYYDKNNAIGFDKDHKIYNARVVHGRLVWTDNNRPVYQMDIQRAKKSFLYHIGYGYYPQTVEWDSLTPFGIDQIVSNGLNFYKSKIDHNKGTEPRLGNTQIWEKLCLIEDAYYSLDVKNFYFEPVPPKHPPVVVYKTDDSRKINNLRQTLFQVAYRYVYMDWRKSTFSPASIVPVPQAEEETATGLASEVISLNNKLQITVNLGGEEVRSVEIIGRSSSDPSKWYLIETINKFEEEERGGEVSVMVTVARITMGMRVPQPEVTALGFAESSKVALGFAVPLPTVINTFVDANVKDMVWESDEFGSGFQIPTTIVTATGTVAYLSAIPSWIKIIETIGGTELFVGGSPINNGMEIAIFPRTENFGPLRGVDFVELTDDTVFANKCNILVTHKSSILMPTVGVYVHPEDVSGLVISGESGTAVNGSAWIYITFTPKYPSYGPLVGFGLNYSISRNGDSAGNGIILVKNHVSEKHLLTMTSNAAPADGIQVLLWMGNI